MPSLHICTQARACQNTHAHLGTKAAHSTKNDNILLKKRFLWVTDYYLFIFLHFYAFTKHYGYFNAMQRARGPEGQAHS